MYSLTDSCDIEIYWKALLLKKLLLLVVPVIVTTSLLLAFCSQRSSIEVELDFAQRIEITYYNTDYMESYIEITDETDVNTLKSIFSGTAILSNTVPYMCGYGAITYLKYIGASETFTITIDSHGTLVPQGFEGNLSIDADEWGKFIDVYLKYVVDMSNEQEWLQFE